MRKNVQELSEVRSGGLLGEISSFIRYNKKWWLGSIILMLLLLGVLIILGGSGAAPFIYTLF